MQIHLPPLKTHLTTISIFFLLGLLLFSGFINAPTMVPLGSMSLLSIGTIISALLYLAILVLRPRISLKILRLCWPFLFLIAYGAITFLWYPVSEAGIQNLLSLTGFTGVMMLSYQVATRRLKFSRYLIQAMWLTLIIATTLHLVFLLFPAAKIGVTQRQYAIFAIILVAFLFARDGQKKYLRTSIAFLLIGLVFFGLSRTGAVTCVCLFAISYLRPRDIQSWIRTGILMVFGGCVVITIILASPSYYNRFFTRDTSIKIGSLAINGSGRIGMWTVTYKSFIEAPILGKGAGSASELMVKNFPPMAHPHNDYLRLLHDYGIIGFLLWVYGYWKLIWKAWTNIIREEIKETESKRLNHAAFLILVGCAAAMVTDNLIAYSYIMIPMAIVVGAGLGACDRETAFLGNNNI